jgi:NTP pyrophosphatase (non-canonical NTP hydrolase)
MNTATKVAMDWATRCFGNNHFVNRPLLALRLAEEVVELAQAFLIPKEKMIELVEIVYGRPPGDPRQELGDVALSVSVLAASYGKDIESFLEDELRRVLCKQSGHFTKRNQEKIDLGLTA